MYMHDVNLLISHSEQISKQIWAEKPPVIKGEFILCKLHVVPLWAQNKRVNSHLCVFTLDLWIFPLRIRQNPACYREAGLCVDRTRIASSNQIAFRTVYQSHSTLAGWVTPESTFLHTYIHSYYLKTKTKHGYIHCYYLKINAYFYFIFIFYCTKGSNLGNIF